MKISSIKVAALVAKSGNSHSISIRVDLLVLGCAPFVQNKGWVIHSLSSLLSFVVLVR